MFFLVNRTLHPKINLLKETVENNQTLKNFRPGFLRILLVHNLLLVQQVPFILQRTFRRAF